MNAVQAWDELPLPWIDKIAYLTYEFLKQPQVECPLSHRFEKGYYIRTLKIPAGTLFLGRAHRHGHLVKLIEGRAIWIRPEVSEEVRAPKMAMTAPGCHIVANILEDVVCETWHLNPGENRDIDALEAHAFESVEHLKTVGAQLAARIADYQRKIA